MSLEDVLQPVADAAGAKKAKALMHWIIALGGLLFLVASASASGAFYVGVELTKFRLREERHNETEVKLTAQVEKLTKQLDTRDDDMYARLWATFRLTNWDCYPIPYRGGTFKGCSMTQREMR